MTNPFSDSQIQSQRDQNISSHASSCKSDLGISLHLSPVTQNFALDNTISYSFAKKICFSECELCQKLYNLSTPGVQARINTEVDLPRQPPKVLPSVYGHSTVFFKGWSLRLALSVVGPVECGHSNQHCPNSVPAHLSSGASYFALLEAITMQSTE